MTAEQRLPAIERVITQTQIDRYATASGDFNPIHIDAAFAATTPMGGTIAHGMLVLALIALAHGRASSYVMSDIGAIDPGR